MVLAHTKRTQKLSKFAIKEKLYVVSAKSVKEYLHKQKPLEKVNIYKFNSPFTMMKSNIIVFSHYTIEQNIKHHRNKL